MSLSRYFSTKSTWGIEVRTCGYYHAEPNSAYPPGGHPSDYSFKWRSGRKLPGFHIVYFPSGSGVVETRQIRSRRIRPGDVLFLYEHEWHRYKPNPSTGWEEYWVGFDGDYFREHILRDVFPEKCSHIKSVGFHEEILWSFEHLLYLSRRAALHNKVISGTLPALIALILESQAIPEKGTEQDKMLEDTLFTIRQHLNKDLDFERLAARFGMSYSGYRKFFKRHTGLALNQYLIKEKLMLAQRLIRNTSLPLSEIAAKTGFESLHYFSRLYKLKLGYSPSKEKR